MRTLTPVQSRRHYIFSAHRLALLRTTLLVILGFLAASSQADIAQANGGSSIANAPELPIGEQIQGGGNTNTSPLGPTDGGWTGCCYGEYWRITLSRGDHLRIDYGSLDGNVAEVALYTSGVTDYTWNQGRSNPLFDESTSTKDEARYVAAQSGRFTLYVVHDCGACGSPVLAYELTAYIQHYTHATLAGTRVVRAHGRLTLRGEIAGLSKGKVAIQSRQGKRWKTLKLSHVTSRGGFAVKTEVGAPGTYRFRVVFFGDVSHLPTSAVYSVKVV